MGMKMARDLYVEGFILNLDIKSLTDDIDI